MLKKIFLITIVMYSCLCQLVFAGQQNNYLILLYKDDKLKTDWTKKILEIKTHWEVGPWSETKYDNGQCYQSREIVCKTNNGKITSDENCSSPKPDTIQIVECRRFLIVTNNHNSKTLNNFQIKFTFNPSSDPFYTNCGTKGQNLGIWDGNNQLPIWIEKWTSYQAIVWTKVSNIRPLQTKMYNIYCNVTKASANNPKLIFDFYDDFETWSGWQKYQTGDVKQSNAWPAHSGNYVLDKYLGIDPNGGVKSLGFTLNYPFVLDVWTYKVVDGGWDRIGVINNSIYGYGLAIDNNYSNKQVSIEKRTPNSNAWLSSIQYVSNWASFGSSYRTWRNIKYIWNSGKHKIEVYDTNGNKLTSTSGTDYSYNSFNKIYVFGGYEYLVDDLKIYKYIEPAPTVIVK